ncbi:MAG: hypothetical protein HYS21_11575 [Deltaproteobacteria bacterium]|nr:hypothetical protein [Deltaproteobacteria bacterium]
MKKQLNCAIFAVLTVLLGGCAASEKMAFLKEDFEIASVGATEESRTIEVPSSWMNAECLQEGPLGRDYVWSNSIEENKSQESPPESISAQMRVMARKKAVYPIKQVVVKGIKTGIYLYTWLPIGFQQG